jgi:hypothetical protein
MRTIRLERIDKEIPQPDRNPIVLHSTEDANLYLGDIRYIKTGFRFYFPADIQRNIKSSVPGMVILDSTQPEVEGCFQLIVLCCAVEVRIGRGQPVANLSLFEIEPMVVRFAEFVEGKRVICGGAVEARPDLRDTKSGT